MSTLAYCLAAFGTIHLLVDLALVGFLWWFNHEAKEDQLRADAFLRTEDDDEEDKG